MASKEGNPVRWPTIFPDQTFTLKGTDSAIVDELILIPPSTTVSFVTRNGVGF